MGAINRLRQRPPMLLCHIINGAKNRSGAQGKSSNRSGKCNAPLDLTWLDDNFAALAGDHRRLINDRVAKLPVSQRTSFRQKTLAPYPMTVYTGRRTGICPILLFWSVKHAMPYQFTIATGENPEARAVVEEGLSAFNAQFIGQRSYETFEAYARNDANHVIGGMFGHSGMDWLYVDYLWVEKSHRGSGLGARLLSVAEEEALTRKCVGIFLYTYSFQALEFYKKHGFTVMGRLDNCPAGHQRIYLSKPVASLPPKA